MSWNLKDSKEYKCWAWVFLVETRSGCVLIGLQIIFPNPIRYLFCFDIFVPLGCSELGTFSLSDFVPHPPTSKLSCGTCSGSVR